MDGCRKAGLALDVLEKIRGGWKSLPAVNGGA
jgi:hypothetical protein